MKELVSMTIYNRGQCNVIKMDVAIGLVESAYINFAMYAHAHLHVH